MNYDIFERDLNEQIRAEKRENKDVTDAEYKYALRYFGLNSNSTEEEAKIAYKEMVKNNVSDSKKTQEINGAFDILKQHFKHIKWKKNIKNKRVEIADNMKNAISTKNIEQNFGTHVSNLQQVYLKYYGKINYVNTIAGLERLYNLYLEELTNKLNDFRLRNLNQSRRDSQKNQSGIYIMKYDYISADASLYPIAFYLYNKERRTLVEIKNGEVTQEINSPEDIILNNLIPIENVLSSSKKYKKDSYFAILDDTEYFSDGNYRLTMTKANAFDDDFIFLLHYGKRWIQDLTKSNEQIDSTKIIEILKKYLESCSKQKKTKFNTR